MPYMIERSTEPPSPKVYCSCDVCGGEIYVGEDYYNFNGDVVCDDCKKGYIRENFRRCAE